MQEIYFGEKNVDEKAAFDALIGDQLDITSSEVVKLAMCGCELITKKIFAEMENVSFTYGYVVSLYLKSRYEGHLWSMDEQKVG